MAVWCIYTRLEGVKGQKAKATARPRLRQGRIDLDLLAVGVRRTNGVAYHMFRVSSKRKVNPVTLQV